MDRSRAPARRVMCLLRWLSMRSSPKQRRHASAGLRCSLRLPVLPETGIIEPGAFISYQDGGVARLGLVRSTRIDAGLPEVWQTLGVQSYA